MISGANHYWLEGIIKRIKMKNNVQKSNWIIDAILLTGFLATFFMDVIGLALHQWFGIAVGLLAGYHLLVHRNWVVKNARRILSFASNNVQLYFLMDVILMFGFILILATGLVISTWLDIYLDNYSVWKNIHIAASIGTLSFVIIKIGYHWRWILSVAKRFQIIPDISTERSQPTQPIISSAGLERREFFKLMGILGVASAIAIGNGFRGFEDTEDALIAQETSLLSSSSQNILQNSESPSQENSEETVESNTCKVKCNKRCSFPGHCRRYEDINQNNICDNGECV